MQRIYRNIEFVKRLSDEESRLINLPNWFAFSYKFDMGDINGVSPDELFQRGYFASRANDLAASRMRSLSRENLVIDKLASVDYLERWRADSLGLGDEHCDGVVYPNARREMLRKRLNECWLKLRDRKMTQKEYEYIQKTPIEKLIAEFSGGPGESLQSVA